VKSKIKNLVKDQQLISYLPFGAIEILSKRLGKDRGTIRGVLQGKWVNEQVVQEAVAIIKSDIKRKNEFLQTFEPFLEELIRKK